MTHDLTRFSGRRGHPFHPMLVTVPIGAFVSSLVFDILTHTRAHGLPYLVDGAYWLIGVGLVAAVIAGVFGVIDLVAIPRRTRAFGTAVRHLVLNLAALALFLAGFIWRATDHLELDKTRWGQLALSAVAVAVVAVSAWLGGNLVYRFGVRVAPEGEGYQATGRT